MPDEIVDNVATHRYELVVDGHVASVHYSLKPGVITFIHTEVPKELAALTIATLREAPWQPDFDAAVTTEVGRQAHSLGMGWFRA